MWSVIPSGDVVLADLTRLEHGEFGPFMDEAVHVVQRDQPQEVLIMVPRGKPETARLAPFIDEARERIEGRGVPVRLVYVDDEPNRPRGVNQLVRQTVDDGTEQDRASDNGMPEKDPSAVELGRGGGLKGGKAGAEKLSKERRSEIAQQAAERRRYME